jgi:unsaturated rhamnogalacturonyl hydrolase
MENQIFGRQWSVWMADTVLVKFPELRNRWAYDYGVVCKGLEYVYYATQDERYFNYIKSNMDYFVDEDGNIKYYDMASHNLDFINNGKTLLFLYKETGKEKYLKAVHTLYAQLKEQPRTREGGFWHKDIYPNQMWLDGLYMAEPFYAEYINTFTDGDAKDVILQFSLIEKHLKNPTTNLLYHGWDETKESFWADKVSGCSANYWGRSIGWYACALVDTLDFISEPANRALLINMVKDLASGLIDVQSQESGLWYQVLDKADLYGNYPEASCSCMFTYFLFKAVSKGYIDNSYYQYAKKAYQGITREFIEVDQNTFLNLKDTVYVSGLGGNKMRDGSYEYYISEPKQINNLLGIGAFLMAATQAENINKEIIAYLPAN